MFAVYYTDSHNKYSAGFVRSYKLPQKLLRGGKCRHLWGNTNTRKAYPYKTYVVTYKVSLRKLDTVSKLNAGRGLSHNRL